MNLYCVSHWIYLRWMTEQLRLEGTAGGHLVQGPAEAGLPRAGCPAYSISFQCFTLGLYI